MPSILTNTALFDVIKIIKLYSEELVGYFSSALSSLCQIGPIRAVPGRHFEAHIPVQTARWYDGNAAWDSFVAKPYKLDNINYWLSDGLATGFKVFVKNTGFNTLVGLESSSGMKVAATDVGVGISQIIPVIASVFDDGDIVCIEQPELHIHPALQIKLADMFISAAIGTGIPELLQAKLELAKTKLKEVNSEGEKEFDVSKLSNVVMSALHDLKVSSAYEYFISHCNFNDDDINKLISFEKCKKQLLIETHSEHLVLRLLRRVREADKHKFYQDIHLMPWQIRVNYIQQQNGQSEVTLLPLTSDGDFELQWPGGFFEERDEELF